MSLIGCSSFIINGGVFTNVNGSSHEERKELTIFDDYNRIKPGDLRIEENICTTSVRRDFHGLCEDGRRQYRLWRNVNAHRNLGIARLRGEDKEDKFLCVTYAGRDAFKAFKQDFDQFSRTRNANVAQIFGYNNNKAGLPALVFDDALIPLGRIIIEGYQFLPLLYSYFAHQFGRMQSDLSVENLLLGELWVNPRTGALQKGPYIELPFFQSSIMYGSRDNTRPDNHSTHLPIQTYSDDDTIFEYLTRMFGARTILRGIRFASVGFWQHLANEQVIDVLSFPGAIYNRRSRGIIARLPCARERWHYEIRRVQGRIPDAMRESQVVMPDGLVRFTATSTDIQDLWDIDLQYMLCPLGELGILTESWLAQSHSIFSQLRIHEDDWEYCSHLGYFTLRLERIPPHEELNIPLNVYLFTQPVPRPSDDETIWRSWVDNKYFWSFDPLGREMVPELVRAHSGLPSFTPVVASYHYTWSSSHYSAVRKFHTSKGFDPATTDFASSLGFPILEVIGDDSRFEDLEESSLDTSIRGVVRTPTINSSREPEDLGERVHRRKGAQAGPSNRGATGTTTAQGSGSHRKALGTSTLSINSEESSPETLEDHPGAQAGPSTRTSKATAGRYHLRHRETSSFVVPNDRDAVTPETRPPPKGRKQKHEDDLDNVLRKKSRTMEHNRNKERKRRQSNEPDSASGRPKKRRRRLW